MSHIREFDKGMWENYAGAERWPDGSEPLYYEKEGWLIIACLDGLEAYEPEDRNAQSVGLEQRIYRLDISFPTQECARVFLESLKVDWINRFGFK